MQVCARFCLLIYTQTFLFSLFFSLFLSCNKYRKKIINILLIFKKRERERGEKYRKKGHDGGSLMCLQIYIENL